MLLSGCCTTPPATTNLPKVNWPTWPNPVGVVSFDESTGAVSMPLDYWLAIARYQVDVDAARKLLQEGAAAP